MQKKVQNKGETVLNFFLDVVSTCKRYQPAIEDKEVIRYFLQSVRPEYCAYLSTLQNDNLSQLEDNLLKAERFVALNNRNKERYQSKGAYKEDFPNAARKEVANRVTFHESEDIPLQLNEIKQLVQSLQIAQRRDVSAERARFADVDTRANIQQGQRGESNTYDRSDQRANHPRSRSPYDSRAPGRGFTERNERETRDRDYCDICNNFRHKTANCWYNARNPIAIAQGRFFKQFNNLPAPGPGYRGDYAPPEDGRNMCPTGFAGAQTQASLSTGAAVHCRYCKKPGHEIANCRKLRYKNKQKNGQGWARTEA